MVSTPILSFVATLMLENTTAAVEFKSKTPGRVFEVATADVPDPDWSRLYSTTAELVVIYIVTFFDRALLLGKKTVISYNPK